MKDGKAFVIGLVVLCLLTLSTVAVADPPRLPVIPPRQLPCQPLICLQITDAQPLDANEEVWRFEFEALNWSAFTDSPCPPGASNCVDNSSAGLDAEGLVFVRSAGLSTATFDVRDVDLNGAPLGVVELSTTATVDPAAGGLEIDLGQRFVSRVIRVTNDSKLVDVPPTCFALEDEIEGRIQVSTDMACSPFVELGDNVSVDFETLRGDMSVTANTWTSNLCTQDQIIWSQDRTVTPPLVIPAQDTNLSPCPTTCEEKDSLGNVLDGFVVDVDFRQGDRLIFNWHLLGNSGPIAAGAPPTPTNRGTLQPSSDDPFGFTFGSYQLDFKGAGGCQSGTCDTQVLTTPIVDGPAATCLVDEKLNRNDLPFDIYISLGTAGPDPDCSIASTVARDSKELERLVVRATNGPNKNEITVVFRNVDRNAIDKIVTEPLQNGSLDIPTDDLLGNYEVTGNCRNTVTDVRSDLNTLELAVPRRGDLAQVPLSTQALELDQSGQSIALTGQMPAVGQFVDACTFVQLRDSAGNVTILGSDPVPISQVGNLQVFDNQPPVLQCQAQRIDRGTDSDGGGDCSVDVSVVAEAVDAAGGFTLTNDLDPLLSTRSFGVAVNGPETASQVATATFDVGPETDVTFTVVDDAGASDSCTTTVQIADDTMPVAFCDLIPIDTGQGQGTPGGGGPPGQGGGGPPGQGGGNNGNPQNNMFVVDFSAVDNCSASSNVTLMADIDGAAVSDNEQVQITLANPGGTLLVSVINGRQHIQTPGTGVLTVTATDEAGNQTVCTTQPLR